ncbi:MAG TPA: endonuclease/exonuclease/phosphatase family protein [Candidatus Saccharimonadales bacterium]|nr:endonuclease/exonuclease/phosphatase family protein [Candidatus Saccharimonadales bacterium]
MVLKCICLNMWWGGNLFPAIIDFLRAEDADVVCLQEVHDAHEPSLKDRFRSMDVLREQLGYPHDDFAESHILKVPEGRMPSGNAVLSKFPITGRAKTYLFEATQDEYLDVPEQWPIFPRILEHVTLDVPAGEINVFNMHGVWDLAGDNPGPGRRQMVERTLAAMQGKPNVILTGDTNASNGNPVLDDLDAVLTDVFERKLPTTFNMRRKDKPGYATAAVDHMWVSPSFKVVSKDCPDVDISDHRPLVVTLELA